MLLTLTTTHRPATDLGFLLRKNPARAQSFSLTFGRAHVFYPVAAEERCTAALLVEVDPVGLVRNRRGPAGEGGRLESYVNDRPYAASSFLSVALADVFGSALAGHSRERPELADQPLPLSATLSALPCRGGADFLRKLFEPLGYRVNATRLPLDARFPDWGESACHRVELEATLPLHRLLSHLYVLVPVLDNDKHYWVGDDEVAKLLRHGEGWLATHPEREAIARRYLKHQRSLVTDALAQLADEGEPDPDATAETRDAEEAALEQATLPVSRLPVPPTSRPAALSPTIRPPPISTPADTCVPPTSKSAGPSPTIRPPPISTPADTCVPPTSRPAGPSPTIRPPSVSTPAGTCVPPTSESAGPALPAHVPPAVTPPAADARHAADPDPALSLNEQRLGTVLAVLKASGAQSVLDLGCGEGRLLSRLLKERQFARITGLDVSHRALEDAAENLHFDRLPPLQKQRLKLLHGSLLYRDERLAGFDAAAVVEVVEHLDPPRLAAFERVLFEFAQPRTVVLTTPNREYNVKWETLPAGRFRHRDHRFEWTRAEFQAWAGEVAARFGYTVRFLPVGPEDAAVGAPTQMAVLTRPAPTSGG